ncbi:MAG: DUF2779 domain-containing protein, partial [Candidatus Paceibacterota bacterium]
MYLSKSEYMMYLKHPAWLWLKKHDKEKLPEPDANLQAIFDAGIEFEKYANKRFKDGVTVGFDSYNEYLSMPQRTAEAIESGADIIFQGRFVAGKLTCISDVIERVDGDTFNLYEVKSSTKVKKEHYPDLAFQTIVLESAGLNLREIKVIHVDNTYVRDGEIDPIELSAVEDVTEKVRDLIEETKYNIKKAVKVVNRSDMPDPSPRHADPSFFSDWMDIYKNVRDIDPYSIYHLASPGKRRIGELEDMGIERIHEIPDTYDNLTERQQTQITATKKGGRTVCNEEIQEFLGELTFPLYFLDYETAMSAVPLYDGTRPYQQVPFQYSLHILDSPEGEIVHKEYLHDNADIPVPALLKHLQEDMGPDGSVIVWYEPFEKSRNKEMAEMYPEYKNFLENVNDRVVDLMIPFKQGWLADKDFFGSASIKYVLPVLVPSISYKALNIQEGASAQRMWMDTALKEKEELDKEQVLKDLVEYCKLDTLAMVEIWRVL